MIASTFGALAWRLLALAGLLLAGSAPASAQEFRCAPLQPSQAQQPPYQRVPGQARCEGFFARNVSQPFVELVSLTRDLREPTSTATAFHLTASRKTAARLVVHPLRPGPFYRVDALIDAGQALQWDAAPMLGATGLRLRDLGFLALALAPRDDTMTVLPLSLSLIPTPTPTPTRTPAMPGPLPPPTLQAVLRVSVPVGSMSWRRYRLDGPDDGASGWREIAGPPRFAWDRVPLAIDLPADGKRLHVDVQAIDAAGKALPLLRFIVLGPDDAGT